MEYKWRNLKGKREKEKSKGWGGEVGIGKEETEERKFVRRMDDQRLGTRPMH